MKKIKIIIADDHAIVRKGLIQIISETPDFELVDEASDGNMLLEKIVQHDLDIVLLDIAMPGKTGWEAILEIKNHFPNLPVLILSVSSEENYAIQFYKAGASGYITKDEAPEELVIAIRKVVSGGKYVSPLFAEKLLTCLEEDNERPPHENLSPREFQVLVMISSGKTLTEIAKELYLGIPTIGTYRRRILEKLGLDNTAQIIKYSYENKIV